MLRRILSVWSFLALLAGATIVAQEFRSTISGLVTDAQGAAVPASKITLIETATGARFEAETGATGQYTVTFVPPGQYSLSVENKAFKKYVQEGIQVGTNQRLTIDVTLQIGSMSESVTVTADASLLQTATASVGQVIATNQIESMPMNGRTPLTLAQLAYGVTPSSDPRFTRPFDNAGPSGFSMGGGQSQSNELLIDGSPDMTRNRRVAYNPPVDAVTEVKVEAFQADAAYGNTGGGTVNVVMKGGTNEFHGTAYEFNQVSALKATQFFTNAANQRKPVTRFNQYGVTAGGPIWIPKLFDGRNKVFWFFGFEGIRQSEPEPLFSTVATAEQRAGNFSQLLALGNQYQIYDPTTGVLEGGQIRRQPFAGNIIPSGRISPIARNTLQQLIPLPNQAGGRDGLNNYFNNTVRSDRFESFMGRLDVNASDRHKFFWNFRTNDRLENRGQRFGNIATGNNLSRINWGTTFDDVYTFTPTLILNTRLNWTRFVEGSTRPSDGFDFTTLGFPQSLRAASAKLVVPQFDFATYQDIGDSGGDRTPFDTFQIFSAMTKVAGKHTLKFGTDLRRQIESSNSFGNSSGSYTFNTNWTRGPLFSSAGSPIGQDMAAFLLGYPSGGNFQVNATRTQKADYMAFFVQDDWRVKSNLTLNIGVRYEYETATVERYNRTVRGFDPNAVNSATNAARAAYAASPNAILPAAQFNPTGGVLFSEPGNRGVYSTYPAAFSPRFGFSWTPGFLGTKTVLRGGVGMFYFTYGTFGIQQPGFSATTPLAADINNFLSPVISLANPFPEGIQQPVGAANGVNTFLGQNVTFANRDLAQPYTWRWNFNIQREIGRNLVFEIGYMGSRATKLVENRDLNFVPDQFLSASVLRDQPNINRLVAVTANPFRGLLPGTGLNGATTQVENLTRTYPQFNGNGGVRVEALNNGWSNFHSMQTRLEKRYTNGFNFIANFQWQKMMEATGRLYAAAPQLEYRIADEDRPLRFVFSGSYELPFGKGKALMGSAGRGLDMLVGGWQMNAIYSWQSGSPVEWGNIIYLGGDLQWDARNVARSFDTTRFVRAAADQPDRNRRYFNNRFTTYRADQVNNLDFSLFKNLKITERITAQLRGEAFNALNRAVFNGPQLGPTNTAFGTINSQANLNRAIQLALRLKW